MIKKRVRNKSGLISEQTKCIINVSFFAIMIPQTQVMYCTNIETFQMTPNHIEPRHDRPR